MSATHRVREDEGKLALLGELTFDAVPGLCQDLESVFKRGPRLCVDLSGVERVDSAGLALLIEWTRVVRASGHSLEFVNAPQALLTIARVSGVERLLPFSQTDAEADGHDHTGDRL